MTANVFRLSMISLVVGVVASLDVSADEPTDYGTYNIKDALIVIGNGHGDRDGASEVQPAASCPDQFVGDGIPDVFQAFLLMELIQGRGNTQIEAAVESNNLEWIGDVNAFSDVFSYYMASSPGGRNYALWSAEVCFPFDVEEENYTSAAFGWIGADDDPNGNGKTNLEDFRGVLEELGLPEDFTTWTVEQWGVAFEDAHGLGVGIGDDATPDAMLLFVQRALAPADPVFSPLPVVAPVGLAALALAMGLAAARRLAKQRGSS